MNAEVMGVSNPVLNNTAGTTACLITGGGFRHPDLTTVGRSQGSLPLPVASTSHSTVARRADSHTCSLSTRGRLTAEKQLLSDTRVKHGWFSSSDDEEHLETTDFVGPPGPTFYSSGTCSFGSEATLVNRSSSARFGPAQRLSSDCRDQTLRNGEPTNCISVPVSDNNTSPVQPANSVSQSESVSGSQRNLMLHVSDLSRKRYTTLNRKYVLYFWYLIIISIFYGLPAVQLIMIYQKTLIETGNEDLCYYNFACARPFGIFTAFNNIISNLGYVMLGLLFLAVTARRDLLHRSQMKQAPDYMQSHGIPQHYGLFYAMGLALTMEGIMSACYHMCPSFSNFQFDTAYMYILAALIILKIYQTRHPDVNASAHSAYMVMAVVIFLGVTGVVYGSETFWIAFTIFFLLLSVILTAEIYYMGQWNVDLCLPRRLNALIRSDGINCLRPIYVQRMILLLIANLVNFALAGYGVALRPRDFSSFLLSVFMINVLMYTLFYIIMKLRHRERILLLPVLYLMAGLACWMISMYFFIRRNTTWEVTPAQSRALNRPCMLLNFYDAHDIWHFLSATSMFFSFMMLMNLDDDLVDRPRNCIAVF
ncbi:SID1 transmembrane family member [Paragonimus heterotremus]|uniref:SID1 transmembrane family member n=1 Tax=Paragonimus heterotremus TaxID=100268 RepID=A0A8J4WGM4_9TREM|nr:SID1 transmembrane family member [Paragonimus heterotremus]